MLRMSSGTSPGGVSRPASINKTRRDASSDSRAASVAPAEPAPTTITSTSRMSGSRTTDCDMFLGSPARLKRPNYTNFLAWRECGFDQRAAERDEAPAKRPRIGNVRRTESGGDESAQILEPARKTIAQQRRARAKERKRDHGQADFQRRRKRHFTATKRAKYLDQRRQKTDAGAIACRARRAPALRIPFRSKERWKHGSNSSCRQMMRQVHLLGFVLPAGRWPPSQNQHAFRIRRVSTLRAKPATARVKLAPSVSRR